jgi:hypothetical protein
MAVDIDAYKRDLEQLKSQRSVVQAKLDEAVRHAAELMQTLKSFGYNTVEEAEQAYVRQLAEAEQQHKQVQKLIMEINSLDQKLPTREEVAARLQSLSVGNVVLSEPDPERPMKEDADFGDGNDITVIASAPIKPEPQVVESNPIVDSVVQFATQSQPNVKETIDPAIKDVNLSDVLFASL